MNSNSMRKIFFISVALALAAFALPSVADSGKKFSLQMQIVSAPPAPTPPPFTVSATIGNEGNSTISSFNLFVSGLTVVGVDQPATGAATFTGSSVSVKNMHPLKSGQSLTVTIRVNSCGDGQWSAVPWTGSSLNGQTFSVVAADSAPETSIPCGNLANGDAFVVPDSINPDCVTGQRGYYDKDRSIPGGSLSFFVTNTVPTNDQLHFRWPDVQTGGDPLADFEYTVCGTGPLPDAGTAQVAWLNTDGSAASTPGTPAYVTALDCLAPDQLPTPYGTLVGGIGSGDTTLTVNALSPTGAHGAISHASPPFDIVIGTERMTVTAVSSDDGAAGDLSDAGDFDEGEAEQEVWTVTRAVLDGTLPAAHANGVLVMSTPLPYLPANTGAPYIAQGHPAPGKFVQAQVCIASESEAEDHQSHTTTLIDIGDGWIKGP